MPDNKKFQNTQQTQQQDDKKMPQRQQQQGQQQPGGGAGKGKDVSDDAITQRNPRQGGDEELDNDDEIEPNLDRSGSSKPEMDKTIKH